MLRSIEALVKGSYPAAALAAGSFQAVAYDENVTRFVEKAFTAEAVDWESIINSWRKHEGFERAAIASEVLFDKPRTRAHIPLVQFLPGVVGIGPEDLGRQNRHTDAFWEGLRDQYPNKRFMVFDQRSRYVGYLEAMQDPQESYEWLTFLADHPRVVDPRWLTNVEAFGKGGLVEVRAGSRTARLVRWVTP